MTSVSGNEYHKKVLNQYMESVNRSGVYNEMTFRFYEPKTRLRLSIGALYRSIFVDSDNLVVGQYEFLNNTAAKSYAYLFSNLFSTLKNSGEILFDNAEEYMFERWFPIQKTVANAMGHTILSSRGKTGFITPKHVAGIENEMEPGDFMLQRRNWHLSNVGIPGFWTHAALYTGDLDKMNTYFASIFPYNEYLIFSDYLSDKFPDVYKQYTEPDKSNFPKAVIEAIEPGVVIQSLEKSAEADFVVVLRAKKLNKIDKFLALDKAFSNVGRAYDYNFDFDTLDTLVCSELVYDAYHPSLPSKNGINFETSLVNGRKMVSPLDMAKKFAKEHDNTEADISFVYFLKGNEETGEVRSASEEDFIESTSWSKFTFLQN